MAPMRSSTPSRAEVRVSSSGRKSSIRGTMIQCKAPHAVKNSTVAASNNQRDPRAKADRVFNKASGTDGEAIIVNLTACQEL